MMTARQTQVHTLCQLLAGISDVDPRLDRAIAGLSLDSRTLQPGDAFFALRGQARCGEEFIDAAIARGAAAVFIEADEPAQVQRGPVPLLALPGLRAQVGAIASRFHDHPSVALAVLGVTGTNGKTSVTHLLAQALNHLSGSRACGVIGTIGCGFLDALDRSSVTTPDPVSLQGWFAKLRDAGARAAALEVSSHGLDQDRVAGTRFAAAAFTNLTRDHLDYHGDMAAYGAAKRKLFQTPGLGAAVVNLDDPFSFEIIADLAAAVRVRGYSRGGARFPAGMLTPDVLGAVSSSGAGTGMIIDCDAGRIAINSRLLGHFNAMNLLAAFSVLQAIGVPAADAATALSRAHGVPGRMEPFGGADGAPRVVVDYAHTPDGLQAALKGCRAFTAGALWCVFGCGGNRDVGKRPIMGAIAARLADRVVVTSDNPRDEDPDAIIRQIQSGMPEPATALLQPDREAAIRQCVVAPAPADLILVAGKGHEDYQEIEGVRRPFSDRAIVLAALRERQGGRS